MSQTVTMKTSAILKGYKIKVKLFFDPSDPLAIKAAFADPDPTLNDTCWDIYIDFLKDVINGNPAGNSDVQLTPWHGKEKIRLYLQSPNGEVTVYFSRQTWSLFLRRIEKIAPDIQKAIDDSVDNAINQILSE